MSLRIGIVGTGSFAQSFIPLFKAHPLVGQVVLCDLDGEKLARNAAKHVITDLSPSLDALCDSSIDAVCLFTQNWLHGPQSVQALEAGKHVYSAVPPGISYAEIENLVAAAARSSKVYMLGETSYYTIPAYSTAASSTPVARSARLSMAKPSTTTIGITASTTWRAGAAEKIGAKLLAFHRCTTRPTRRVRSSPLRVPT